MSDIKVDIDIDAIHKRFFENAKLNKQISQIVLDESEDYTPYRTGATTKSGRAYDGYITYGTEYAPKIYTTPMNFHRDVHSRATDHWVEEAFDDPVSNESIIRRIQDEIDRS